MTPATSLPLFGAQSPPPVPPSLAGWRRGDGCLLGSLKDPTHWRKAVVIAVGCRSHVLTLRAEAPDAIVQVQMPDFARLLRRPPAAAGRGLSVGRDAPEAV